MSAAERAQRSALKGTEQRLFNLVYGRATPEQWAVWLRAPLECAVHARDLGTTVALLKAGASPLRGEETERLSDFLLTHPTSRDKRGDSIIHVACRLQHDHRLVEAILSRGADKEASDKDGRSPLRLAVEHSNLSAVKALLSAGADFDRRCSSDGCTALDVATIRAELEIMAALTRAGADVNGACARGYTALHRAAFHNRRQALELLLQAGARVDVMDLEGWTPLFDACAEGATDAIVSLLRHGANSRHLDNRGRSLLHVAAEREHSDAVLLLLEHGEVDVGLRFGSSQSSALDFAVVAGNGEVTRVLIERGGADVNAAMIDGRTTLHRAAFFNKPTAIDVLFRAGADLEAKTHSNCGGTDCCGWTPIFDAAAEGSTDAVVALLNHRAAHGAADSTGRTPLHVAAEAEHAEVCAALLDAGADPFLRYGADELSVLDLAAREGNVDLVLAIARARPTGLSWASSRGYTALHHAAARNEGLVVDALLDARASVNATDAQGWTPLFDGCAKGSSDAVVVLLEHGADTDALDLEGRSPLHIAAQGGFRGVIEHLLAGGAAVGRRFGKSESSALDLAVVEGNLDVLMTIVAHGRKKAGKAGKAVSVVDLNAKDSTGRTALHRGAFFDQVGAVGALLRGGANAAARDDCGRTPLDVAFERGSAQTAAFLLSACPASSTEENHDAPPSYDELQRMDAEVALADAAWCRRRLLVMHRARLSSKLLESGSSTRKGGIRDVAVGSVGSSSAPVAPASLFRTGNLAAGGKGKVGGPGPGAEEEESSAKTRPLRKTASATHKISAGSPKKGATTPPSRTEGAAGGKGYLVANDGGRDEEMRAKTRSLRATPFTDVRRLPASGGGGGVAGVMEWTLVLEEDGLFRNIVGFL